MVDLIYYLINLFINSLGKLENGFTYLILPNSNPPGRFEAHLEVLSGSANELERQQGMAHLIEHVAYMGSPKVTHCSHFLVDRPTINILLCSVVLSAYLASADIGDRLANECIY